MSVSGYTGTDALSGFPVLVRLAQGSPSGFSYSDCMADGADIHFVDGEGNDIPCEVDTWNVYGTSLVWVRLPVLTNNVPFEMRYGGGIAAPLASTGTWDGYDAVWHFADGGAADSTAHGYHGSLSSDTITAEAGKVGGAVHLPAGTKIVTASTPNAPLAPGIKSADWMAAAYATANSVTFVTHGAKRTDAAGFIVVADSPSQFGAPSPDYGLVSAEANETVTFTCPASGYNETRSVSATCTGWNLYLVDAASPFRTSADAGESALSCTVVYSEPVRLEWLWGDLVEHGWRYNPSANTITQLGEQAFYNCTSLPGEVAIGTNGVFSLSGAHHFRNTKITRLVYGPGAPARMPDYLCAGCTALTDVSLADTVTKIGSHAFEGCSALTSIRIPDGVTDIYACAFLSCAALATVEPFLPESVTSIGGEAFLACVALTNDLVLRPPSAIALGDHTFNQCRSIVNMTLGTNVVLLPQGFTRWEDKLRNVSFEGDKPAWHANAFMDMGQYKFRFVVPADNASWTAYAEDSAKATPWTSLSATDQQKYIDAFPGEPYPRALTVSSPAKQWIVSYGMVVEGEKDLVISGDPGLYGASSVSPAYGTYTNLAATLGLPLTLTAIGSESFSLCTSLTNVVPFLPVSVTNLAWRAFYCDTNLGGTFMGSSPYLGRIEFGDEVTTISDVAFGGCASLTNVVPFLPASLRTLGRDAFRDCPKLTGSLQLGTDRHVSLVLGTNNGYQFYNTGLTNATVGPGVTALTTCLFENSILKSVTLQSVSSIGLQTFNLTPNLTELRFAGPVPATVNANAYKWAANKARLYLPKGEPTWEDWIAANVIPWAELDKATQYIYWDKWPDGKRPVGRTKSTANPANQWILRWNPGNKQTMIILR